MNDAPATAWAGLDLSPEHVALLDASSISPDVARDRGYATITDEADVRLSPFAPAQRRVPCLHVPGWDVHGRPLPGQVRPDEPREISRGSKSVVLKYESPKGSGSYLDVPPSVRDRLISTTEPFIITEGTRKADAVASHGLVCVSLPGVFSWRGKKDGLDVSAAISAFEAIPMDGRQVIVCYDADVTQKDSVRKALRRLVSYLKTFRADLHIIILDPVNDDPKTGLDDWLAAGNDADELLDMARPADEVLAELDAETAARSTYGRDDRGNARRLWDMIGDEVAWCPFNGWYAYDGQVWRRGADFEVLRRSQGLQDVIMREADQLAALGVSPEEVGKHRAHAHRAGHTSKVKDAVEWLRPNVVQRWDEYDRDPYLLAVGNGTLELKADGSVRLRASDRDDMLTLTTPTLYQPDARAPFFEETVEFFLPDPEVRGYVQRLAGAALIGANAGQTVTMFYGSGANGKSTLLYAFGVALGEDLYVEIDPKSLQENKRAGSSPTPDLMRLLGARLVTAVEASERLDAEMLKRFTGGEKIVARQLHGKPIAFEPAFDLILSMNSAPEFHDRSEGLWRRVVVVPFDVRIPDERRLPQDEVKHRLAQEATGILRWMVEGYAEFRRQGLNPPERIKASSRAMRDSTDWLRAFVNETYEITDDPAEFVLLPTLWADFQSWVREDPTVRNPGRNKFYDEVRKTYGDQKAGPKGKPGFKGWRRRGEDSPQFSPSSPSSEADSSTALTSHPTSTPSQTEIARKPGELGGGPVTEALRGDQLAWLDELLPPTPVPECERCNRPKVPRQPAGFIFECEVCDR